MGFLLGKARRTTEGDAPLWTGVFLFIVLHALGATLFPRFLWGVHHVRYIPLPLAIVLAALALLLLLPAGWRPLSRIARGVNDFIRSGPGFRRAIPFLVAVALFTLLQSRNHFLGDGFLIEELVANHDEWAIGRAGFGSLLVYNGVLRLVQIVFPSAGGTLPFTAINPLAGAAYLIIAASLAREIAGSARGRIALTAALVFPGTLLFFCGYVEDYVLMHLALAGTILLMIRHLRGRISLVAPLAALALACFLHLSACIMVPAFVVVIVIKLKSVPARIAAFAGLLLAGAAASLKLLAYVHEGYGGTGALLPLFHSGAHAYPLFSPYHFHFLFNEFVLVMGGALLLPLISRGKRAAKKNSKEKSIGIFLMAISVMGLAYFVLLDPKLGSRDWDLMALPAIPWLSFLGWLSLRSGREPGRRAVTLIAGACVLHTIPWIVVNADRDRAVSMTLDMVSRDGHYIERGAWANRAFSYLLLEEGYAEDSAEVAERSVRVAGDARDLYNAGIAADGKGDREGAIEWFRRAIAARPDYELPYHDLAKLYMREGNAAEAEAVLRERLARGEDAVSLYLLGLAFGRQSRVDESIDAMRRCVELDDTHAEAWSTLGVGYASAGRIAEARVALERSLELNPDEQRVRDFLATLPAAEE